MTAAKKTAKPAPTKSPAKPKKPTPAPVAAATTAPVAEAPAAAPTPAKPKKSAKPVAPETTAKAGPAGVIIKETAPYYCGVVIRKHGLKAGVTEAMVEEADKMAGRSNPHQTWFNLRNAWHAIRAYTGEAVE